MAMSLGGFFATLTLKTDRASIDRGLKDMDELHDRIGKAGLKFAGFVGDVVKGFALIGGAAVGAAYAISNVQGKNSILAKSANLSYTELSGLSKGMQLLGQDGNKLAASLSDINAAYAELKGGHSEKYEALTKDLAYIHAKGQVGGVNANSFEKLSSVEKVKYLSGIVESYGTNTSDKDFRAMLDNVEKVMPGLADAILATRRNAVEDKNAPGTVAAALDAGHRKDLLNKADRVNLVNADNAMKGLDTSLGGIWEAFGASMAKNLTPYILEFTNMLDKNGPKIKFVFDQIGKGLTDFFATIKPFTDWAASRINTTTINSMYNNVAGEGGMNEILTQVSKKYNVAMPGTDEAKNKLAFDWMNGNEYANKMAKAQQEAMAIYDKTGKDKNPIVYVYVDKDKNVTVGDSPVGAVSSINRSQWQLSHFLSSGIGQNQ